MLHLILGFIIGLFLGLLIDIVRASQIKKTQNQQLIKISEQQQQIAFLSGQTDEYKSSLEQERNKQEKLNTSLAVSQTELQNQTEKLHKQKQEIEQLQKQFTDQFNNLAQKIFEEKSQKFSAQNKEQLQNLLNPLNEKLLGFEKKVEETYIKNVKDRTDLQAEIKKLYDLNARISHEANNLAKALKGDVKKQGNWGELILERILENSGLQKNREYKTQLALTGTDGSRYIPDVVILLPENKHIIIDSKVSLVAYEKHTAADDPEQQHEFLKQHLQSLKNHIKNLADKQYYKLDALNSPEYVLLFIPIEASFSLAVNEDKNLFNYAWENKIVMVSPSTLIATLLTISSIWRQENQTKNALEIAKKGGDLYDKFVGFTENLMDLGNKLKQTQNVYDQAMNKLSSGKGNLVKRSEELKKLGAQTAKTIPESLRAEPDDI